MGEGNIPARRRRGWGYPDFDSPVLNIDSREEYNAAHAAFVVVTLVS